MIVEFVLPQVGMGMTEGTVSQWLVEVGAQVQAGVGLVEVETEKVEVEIESPATGILISILVRAGETVEVGTPLALIEDPSGE